MHRVFGAKADLRRFTALQRLHLPDGSFVKLYRQLPASVTHLTGQLRFLLDIDERPALFDIARRLDDGWLPNLRRLEMEVRASSSGAADILRSGMPHSARALLPSRTPADVAVSMASFLAAIPSEGCVQPAAVKQLTMRRTRSLACSCRSNRPHRLSHDSASARLAQSQLSRSVHAGATRCLTRISCRGFEMTRSRATKPRSSPSQRLCARTAAPLALPPSALVRALDAHRLLGVASCAVRRCSRERSDRRSPSACSA